MLMFIVCKCLWLSVVSRVLRCSLRLFVVAWRWWLSVVVAVCCRFRCVCVAAIVWCWRLLLLFAVAALFLCVDVVVAGF